MLEIARGEAGDLGAVKPLVVVVEVVVLVPVSASGIKEGGQLQSTPVHLRGQHRLRRRRGPSFFATALLRQLLPIRGHRKGEETALLPRHLVVLCAKGIRPRRSEALEDVGKVQRPAAASEEEVGLLPLLQLVEPDLLVVL